MKGSNWRLAGSEMSTGQNGGHNQSPLVVSFPVVLPTQPVDLKRSRIRPMMRLCRFLTAYCTWLANDVAASQRTLNSLARAIFHSFKAGTTPHTFPLPPALCGLTPSRVSAGRAAKATTTSVNFCYRGVKRSSALLANPSYRAERLSHVTALAAAMLMVSLLVGCAKPDPVLTAGTVRAWQANQAVIALGELQRSAITYHSASMLSEANTRVVVEAITPALERIKAAPPSWKPVGLGALNQIDKGLDGKGHERMDVHVAKARSTLNGL